MRCRCGLCGCCNCSLTLKLQASAVLENKCGVLPLLLQPSDDMCCCAQADRHRYLKLRGLSPACRDLLTRMFRADPRQRATISDVMSHPWFQTTLPQVIT